MICRARGDFRPANVKLAISFLARNDLFDATLFTLTRGYTSQDGSDPSHCGGDVHASPDRPFTKKKPNGQWSEDYNSKHHQPGNHRHQQAAARTSPPFPHQVNTASPQKPKL